MAVVVVVVVVTVLVAVMVVVIVVAVATGEHAIRVGHVAQAVMAVAVTVTVAIELDLRAARAPRSTRRGSGAGGWTARRPRRSNEWSTGLSRKQLCASLCGLKLPIRHARPGDHVLVVAATVTVHVPDLDRRARGTRAAVPVIAEEGHRVGCRTASASGVHRSVPVLLPWSENVAPSAPTSAESATAIAVRVRGRHRERKGARPRPPAGSRGRSAPARGSPGRRRPSP